ncbi:hypothetical protein [Agromyces aerolatus]|uniref:hypothetical protein n=1 Tax=Agromyces sp. LY-1074 TaxID=3074080 RepID=UPI002860052A|nr:MULTISPECIES: hypothetical protein [unclassified Agromyces]MDR5701039.1 hypothetical protein [Agromyces sp. LY-1074]MDR5707679.1 hypothetical protein [Agromyces sp. LY-1358]
MSVSLRSRAALFGRGWFGATLLVCLGLTLASGGAGPAMAASADDDGVRRHDAYINDSLLFGSPKAYTAKCPEEHPYLKRFHTGTYDVNGDTGRAVPGGVIVYEGSGPVHVDGSLDEANLTEHLGAGPSGLGRYEAFRGIEGYVIGFGGTSVRIVLWCVSDPFNGAVSPAPK